MDIHMPDTKQLKSAAGFTLIELTVCIAVIAILAVIVSANYNSIQRKSRTATAISQAQEVENKAEVYASSVGLTVYPTLTELTNATGNASVSADIRAMLSVSAPTATTQTTVLQYVKCSSVTGAKVGYWDSALATPAVVYLLSGAATNASIATC
jgi:prepilin-type N-terminal cleavage/methylation domain-containing protein